MAQNTWVAGRGLIFNNYSSSTGKQVINVWLNVNTDESFVYGAAMDHNITAIGNKAVTVYADALENVVTNYRVTTGNGNDMYMGVQKQGVYVVEYVSGGAGNNLFFGSAAGYSQFDAGGGREGDNNKILFQGDGSLVCGLAEDHLYVAVKSAYPGQVVSQNIFVNNFDPTRVVIDRQGQKTLVGGGDTIDFSTFTTLGLKDARVDDDVLILKLGASFLIDMGVPTLPNTSGSGVTSAYQVFTPELHIYGVGKMITIMGGVREAWENGAITFWESFDGNG